MVEDARHLRPDNVYRQHQEKFSKTLLLNQKADRLIYTIDLAIYSSAFTLCDPSLGSQLAEEILTEMLPVSLVLGWGDEFEMVSAASRHGHQVLCSDYSINLPVYMNFSPPEQLIQKRESIAASAVCPPGPPEVHTVSFMMTDGDSVAWNLGNLLSPQFDWWASPRRGSVPLAWTFQPLLQELHPHFLAWMHRTRFALSPPPPHPS